jgi:hypothetical protein
LSRRSLQVGFLIWVRPTKISGSLPQKNIINATKKVSFAVIPKAASPSKDLLTNYPKMSSPQNNLQITGEIQTDNSL